MDGLTGHQRSSSACPVFDQFEQIAAFPVAAGREPPLVKDQESGLRERLHQLPARAIRARMHELLTHEAGPAHMADGVALPTGTLAEGAREPRLAGAGRGVGEFFEEHVRLTIEHAIARRPSGTAG